MSGANEEDSSEINKELFENALSLGDVKLRECLVPRKEIVSINPVSYTHLDVYKRQVLNAGYGFNSYEWQDGSQDSIYIVKQTGTYYVKAVDNCYNIFTDTIKVIVNPAPRLTFQNDTSICTNDSILLDAGNSFKNYLWSNGKTTSLIKVTLPGIYSVIATDSSLSLIHI